MIYIIPPPLEVCNLSGNNRAGYTGHACAFQKWGVRIEGNERKKPGLMPQHLTSVRAAQLISGAEVIGAEIGSSELIF
ncbi:MAG: hypothetical protein L6246_10285, partial [Thermodesulfovibrionales bacterium]|nr:hypothetical protein [Thermodesulfovibrionales bacterium]